jgi:hypothetical protein
MDLYKGENGIVQILNHTRNGNLRDINPISRLLYSEIALIDDFYFARNHAELFLVVPSPDWEQPSTILYSIKFQTELQVESIENILLRKLNGVAA